MKFTEKEKKAIEKLKENRDKIMEVRVGTLANLLDKVLLSRHLFNYKGAEEYENAVWRKFWIEFWEKEGKMTEKTNLREEAEDLKEEELYRDA